MPLDNSFSSIASKPSISFTQMHLPPPGCSSQIQLSSTHSYQLPRLKILLLFATTTAATTTLTTQNNTATTPTQLGCLLPPSVVVNQLPLLYVPYPYPHPPLLSRVGVLNCEHRFCGPTGQFLDSCGREKSEEAVLRSWGRVRGLALWGYWGWLWFFWGDF